MVDGGCDTVVESIFFNDTTPTRIYTLSLHDALPIWPQLTRARVPSPPRSQETPHAVTPQKAEPRHQPHRPGQHPDRKSTRLNSSHANISYAVFCLKKKNNILSSSSRQSTVEYKHCTH